MKCKFGYDCLPYGNSEQEPSICPLGTYSPEGMSYCKPCREGTYQDQHFQTSCKRCPPGHVCPEGAATPVKCSVNTYVSNDETCTSCWPYSYQPLEDQYSCIPCPPGHSCQNDLPCPKPCQQGTFSANGRGCQPCEHCPGITGLTTCAPGDCQQNLDFICEVEPFTFASKLISFFYVRYN